MTVRVATVLSARDWEPLLVRHARETAAIRIVLRAYQPDEIEARYEDIDVVVAGAEVTWVTPRQIATWRRLGLGVVGIHPEGDAPADEMFAAAGADDVLPDTADVQAIVQAVRYLTPGVTRLPVDLPGPVVAVVGPRGAPGCTEIALAVATELARERETLLIDLDFDAPALAIRLGVAPRPDLADAADEVRETGALGPHTLQRVAKLSVLVGSHRNGNAPLRPQMVEDLIEAAAASFDAVVLDLGCAPPDSQHLKRADEAVLVVDGSAVGIVRGAKTAARWSGPPPALVVNRVAARDRKQLVDAARQWTGLEPAAVIPERREIRRSSVSGSKPDKKLRLLVRTLGVGS